MPHLSPASWISLTVLFWVFVMCSVLVKETYNPSIKKK